MRNILDFAMLHRKTNSGGSLPPPPYNDVRPYIGLRARLSQIWLNQYTILLILVIVKLALFRVNLSSSLDSAETYTTNTCDSAQSIASQAASLPHYMSNTANKLIEKSMDAAVEALISTLLLMVTGVENLIIFALELWIGTYACLATAAIDAAAGTAINATESVVHFVNGSLSDITTELQDGLNGIESFINGAENVASDIANFFTGNSDGNDDFKKVNLTVDKLKNLHIPASVNTDLTNLENHVPTYAQVKNTTEGFIREPFDLLKSKLNGTLQAKVGFNNSLIKTPPMQNISFCNTNPGIPQLFDSIHHDISLATEIIIIILVIAAVLVCVPTAYREITSWRWMRKCAERDAEVDNLAAAAEQDRMVAIHDANNHMVVRVQNLAANRFSTAQNKTLARWWVDYMTYPPVFTVGLIAITGLLMFALQYIILAQVMHALPGWEHDIANLVSTVGTDIESDAKAWVNSANTAINATQDDINKNLFGWVNTATTAVNKTIVTFQTDMNTAINDTFGNTPLYKPMSSVVYCVIGSKLQEAEEGLTWVHDHAKVTFPQVDNSLLDGMGLNSSDINFNPQTVSRKTTQSLGTALNSVIKMYKKSLDLELYISLVLLACWVLVALASLLYCLLQRPVITGTPSSVSLEKPVVPPPRPSREADGANNYEFPTNHGNLSDWSIDTGFNPPSFLAAQPGEQQRGSYLQVPHDSTQAREMSMLPDIQEAPQETVQVKRSIPRKSVRGALGTED